MRGRGSATSRSGIDRTRGSRQEGRRRCSRVARLHAEQLPTTGELARALSIAQEAEVANAMKPFRQDMDQEAANKLVGGEGHGGVRVAVPVVFPAEADLAVVDREQALEMAMRWV